MPGISQLSPDEETTLRSIILGVSRPVALRTCDIERLTSLSLIEERRGRLAPTDFGMEKYRSQTKVRAMLPEPAAVPPSMPKLHKPRHARSRTMPFFGLR